MAADCEVVGVLSAYTPARCFVDVTATAASDRRAPKHRQTDRSTVAGRTDGRDFNRRSDDRPSVGKLQVAGGVCGRRATTMDRSALCRRSFRFDRFYDVTIYLPGVQSSSPRYFCSLRASHLIAAVLMNAHEILKTTLLATTVGTSTTPPHKSIGALGLTPALCLIGSCKNKTEKSKQLLITFRVRRSRREIYIGHARLCVCVSVCLQPYAHTTARI